MLPKQVIGREERYLYAIATGDLSLLPKEVIGRYERYLDVIAKNGGTGEHTHINKPVLDKLTMEHINNLEQIGILFENVEG